jgi:hypothetical protein
MRLGGLYFLTSGLAIAATPVSAEPPVQQTTGVIIRQRVPLDYNRDLAGLATQLDTAGERTVSVKSGDTLSHIISREYGVGTSNAREAFGMFERKIVEKNGLADAGKLTASTRIRIPDAFRNALKEPNPANPFNKIPKVAVDPRISADSDLSLDERLQRPSDSPEVDSSFRAGAAEAVRYRLVSEEEAQRIALLDPTVTVESIPFEITFAQADGAGTQDWLSPATKQFIQAKLAAPQKQRPILLILDDSWPDDTAFVRSRNFFVAGIAQVRSAYKLPPASFSGQLQPDSIGWTTAVPTNRHAPKIRDALAPLENLVPVAGALVETVYVPLFARDRGASEILRQLVELNQLLLNIRPPYYGDIKPEVTGWARTVSTTIVNSLERRAADATVSSTDVAVIQAVMNFCSYLSEATKRPCFLSMSWTTPNKWFQPNIPSSFYGLLVAAAGNEGQSTNIYAQQRQFAARSMAPGDILAVMNIDDNGNATCDSSVFGTDLTDVFGVAFAGYLTPTDCGTSFSAPRVAWLLAAREALRNPPAEPWRWQKQIVREVLEHRASGTDYARARFVPEDVFSR